MKAGVTLTPAQDRGARDTWKASPLLWAPSTIITTFPVFAKFGTVAIIRVVLQLVTVAAIPLKVTVLVPWLARKLVPMIVTEVPGAADVGDRLLILGAGADTVVKTNGLGVALAPATFHTWL
jgi:hypothetical protein